MSHPSWVTLEAWIDRVDARQQWSQRVNATGSTVTAYLVNGTRDGKTMSRLFLVLSYPDDHGWELLIPSTFENSTEASIDNAALLLGTEGCAGLMKGGA